MLLQHFFHCFPKQSVDAAGLVEQNAAVVTRLLQRRVEQFENLVPLRRSHLFLLPDLFLRFYCRTSSNDWLRICPLSQALAASQSRFTVIGDTLSTSAASSGDSPP